MATIGGIRDLGEADGEFGGPGDGVGPGDGMADIGAFIPTGVHPGTGPVIMEHSIMDGATLGDGATGMVTPTDIGMDIGTATTMVFMHHITIAMIQTAAHIITDTDPTSREAVNLYRTTV